MPTRPKIMGIETEIGEFDILAYADDNEGDFDCAATCSILDIKTKTCALLGKGFFASRFVSYEALVFCLHLGHDFSTQENINKAINEKESILEKYNLLWEKYDGEWDLMVADLKGDDIAKVKERKEEESVQEELDAAKAYENDVKQRIEWYSEHIEEEDDEVIAVVWGTEEKKEDGKKTSFLEGVFNEGTLIATTSKVIYGSRHITSGRIETEEFIYASIKGIQKKKTGGGFIKLKLISVDDQVYGISTGSLSDKAVDDINKFVKHVNSAISKGVAPSQPAPVADDIPTQLKKLAELKEMGILSDDEFEAKKTELLAKM